MSQDCIEVEMKQLAVGQGGFFRGSISKGRITYRWIYDCGSDNIDDLNNEIKKIKRDEIIDTLYLSHLHRDHINGVDELLKKCKVKQIVLPYLNGYEKILSLLHYKRSDVEETEFATELIMNPEQWRRNFAEDVERIILVHQGDGSESTDGTSTRELDGFVESWDSELSRYDFEDETSGSSVDTYVVRGSAIASVNVLGSDLGWEFVPHVHPISNIKYENFMREVNRVIGRSSNGDLTDAEVKQLANSQSKLKILMTCYENIWKDNNLISMSLYIGPIVNFSEMEGNEISIYNCSGIHRGYRNSSGCYEAYFKIDKDDNYISKVYNCSQYGGWMLTGDSNFFRKTRLDEFKNRYRKYKSIVSILMVPHHGSHYNVIQDFFDFFDNLSLTYVAAGPTNKHRHPSPKVVCMACTVAPFHVVGTDPATELTLKSKWWLG